MASPQDLVPVTDAAGAAEAHIIASMLREAGVDAFVFDTATQTLPWQEVQFINPYSVHVQRSDLERAQQLIKSNREESVDLDWDEVDVGEVSDDPASLKTNLKMAALLRVAARHVWQDWFLIISVAIIILIVATALIAWGLPF